MFSNILDLDILTSLRSFVQKNTSVVLIGNIIGNLLRIVSTVVLTRILTAGDFGAMAIVATALYIFVMLSDVGFYPFIVRHDLAEDCTGHRLGAGDDDEPAGQVGRQCVVDTGQAGAVLAGPDGDRAHTANDRLWRGDHGRQRWRQPSVVSPQRKDIGNGRDRWDRVQRGAHGRGQWRR